MQVNKVIKLKTLEFPPTRLLSHNHWSTWGMCTFVHVLCNLYFFSKILFEREREKERLGGVVEGERQADPVLSTEPDKELNQRNLRS